VRARKCEGALARRGRHGPALPATCGFCTDMLAAAGEDCDSRARSLAAVRASGALAARIL